MVRFYDFNSFILMLLIKKLYKNINVIKNINIINNNSFIYMLLEKIIIIMIKLLIIETYLNIYLNCINF